MFQWVDCPCDSTSWRFLCNYGSLAPTPSATNESINGQNEETTNDGTEVPFGVFGEKILAKYCGSQIATQFYEVSTDSSELFGTVSKSSVLMTEQQMAQKALQTTIEFIVFAFLNIAIQTVFTMYYRCCQYYSDRDAEKNRNDTEQWDRAKTRVHWMGSIPLFLFVMAHFGWDIYHHYDFVNDTVHFNVTESLNVYDPNITFQYDFGDQMDNGFVDDLSYESNTEITSDICDGSGIGEIVCPSLFEKWGYKSSNSYDTEVEYEPPYSEEEAEVVCKWIFYMTIASNTNIFQYSILVSLFLMDTALYFFVLCCVSCAPPCLCTGCSWLLCWLGCCCRCVECGIPQPKCCCESPWCTCGANGLVDARDNVCCECGGMNALKMCQRINSIV